MNKAIIVCGPTASGKTQLAHHFALRNNGEIINADSMQLYKQLPIMTASPKPQLKIELPYHLYNFQNIRNGLSAVKYVNMATNVIKEISMRNKLPIIVGGSGMYINMLINGYSPIPDVNDEIRSEARLLYNKIGPKSFFIHLVKLDPQVKKFINILDNQRMIRAYEVMQQTGKSILDFHNQVSYKPMWNFKFKIIFLYPERQLLYQMCNKRSEGLFYSGGVEEVEQVYKNFGDIKSTAIKTLGFQEILMYLKGEISSSTAIKTFSLKVRHYAKRQVTWFKNQIKSDHIIRFDSEKQYRDYFNNCFQF